MPEMMNITVRNKIATKTDNVAYVCGNSDYVINFDFDSEWDAYDTKTARFAHDGQHTDVVFSGNQCNVPIITNTYAFHVGVFAGDLHTTTAARVPCRKSILCGSGAPADPTPDVYDQLMERMAQLEAPDWNQNDPTAKDYVKNRTHWEESSEQPVGNNYSAWASVTDGGTHPIPKVAIDGKLYENVPSRTSGFYAYYTAGEYTITVNHMTSGVSINPSAEFSFVADMTIVHQIPFKYVPSGIFKAEANIYGITTDTTFEDFQNAVSEGRLCCILMGGTLYFLSDYSTNTMNFTALDGRRIRITGDGAFACYDFAQRTVEKDPSGSREIATKGYVDKHALPTVKAADNGKILKVVDGAWAVVDA